MHRVLKSAIALAVYALSNILKRLGGNENTFGSPLTKLALDGIMEEPSHIRLLALLIFSKLTRSKQV